MILIEIINKVNEIFWCLVIWLIFIAGFIVFFPFIAVIAFLSGLIKGYKHKAEMKAINGGKQMMH